ncbi:MAG TPA: response regulator, partial [Candidatus Paceibacterota bacterium]|nr:response regulator [Candidatus Paceibacterota bacterium]
RTLARGVLHRLGYRVIVAQDGVEALQLWREHQGNFDLVVTDLVMPRGLSGREMAEQLLADKPSLKVIYSTGYSVDLDRFAGSLREGVNFLPKPYPPDALASAVRRQLDS